MKLFRAPNGRIEHFTEDSIVTLCGIDARLGARYTPADNHMDSKVRPKCSACEAKRRSVRHVSYDPWADDDRAW